MSGADLLTGIDRIPWSQVEHAYGPATDTPDLLRAVADGDDSARDSAITSLFGTICHQGTVYEATTPAVPFLARLARDAEMRPEHRGLLVALLACVAAGEDDDARLAVAAEFPTLLQRVEGADAWGDRYLAVAASQVPWAAGGAFGLLDRLTSQNDNPQILAALDLTRVLVSGSPALDAAEIAAGAMLDDEWGGVELEDLRQGEPDRWPHRLADRLFVQGFAEDPQPQAGPGHSMTGK